MAHIVVGHLYADEMNLYGDRGNVLTLARRAEWRGHEVVVEEIGRDFRGDFSRFSLLFMGGGEDAHQARIADDFLRRAEDLVPRLAAGLPMLAICGAYQLLGRFYTTADGRTLQGIGFLDVHTEAGSSRKIGDVVADLNPRLGLEPPTLVGFENHGGETYLGSGVEPLARVRRGAGNNGDDGTEGAISGHVIGTYLHGSLLPKNPHLADRMLAWALAFQGDCPDLAPLPDEWERQAHQVILRRSSASRMR